MVMKQTQKTIKISSSEKQTKVKSVQIQRQKIIKLNQREESDEKDSILDENINININCIGFNGNAFQNLKT